MGRGVPDVAADADPYSGVVVIKIGGKYLEPIGGTSAATPLWASLIARLNEGLGARCGFINPTLYAKCATGVLNDIVTGNNGAYSAGPGWDACTGLGTPNGEKLLSALSSAPSTASASASRKAGPAPCLTSIDQVRRVKHDLDDRFRSSRFGATGRSAKRVNAARLQRFRSVRASRPEKRQA